MLTLSLFISTSIFGESIIRNPIIEDTYETTQSRCDQALREREQVIAGKGYNIISVQKCKEFTPISFWDEKLPQHLEDINRKGLNYRGIISFF